MLNYYYCLIVIFVWSNGQVIGVKKMWLPNLEWEVANNWQQGQLPEENNRIQFPLEKRHIVGLPFGTVKFAGIDLSRDGSLAFNKNGRIEINDFDESFSKIHRWIKKGTFFWADPKNWNYSSEAVPHLQRVPCTSDLVIFPPEDHVLSIKLPLVDIQVAAVQIYGQNMSLSKWIWWNYKNKREFSGQEFTVSYSDNSNCQGCPCQDNNQDAYLEEVCDIQRTRCLAPICHDPLKIEGHCCDYCGGRILISNKIFFPKIKRLSQTVLDQYKDNMNWYIRRNSNGGTEILINEKDSYVGSRSKQVVEHLVSMFKDENIDVQKFEYSGDPYKDITPLLSLAPIFGSLFIVIIFLLVMFKSSGYSNKEISDGWYEFWVSVEEAFSSKSGNSKSFNFARFENISEGNVQLARPHLTDNNTDDEEKAADNENQLASGSRFENPLYRSKSNKVKGDRSVDIFDKNDERLSMKMLQGSLSDKNVEEVEMKIEI